MLQKIIDSPKNLARFYGDVRSELRKVTWPSKKEVYGTTTVVLITIFFFGIYLFVVDLILKNVVEGITDLFR